MRDPTQTPPQVERRDLDGPEQLTRRRLRSRVLFAVAVVVVVVLAVVLLPGLGELRARLEHANPWWLALGVVFKLLSGLGYVAVFRTVFCRRMSWPVSLQIGYSELGANAVVPTGGAGGLALGAWALKRGGMDGRLIARRTVAFFLLTSVPNVAGVIILGVGLALGAHVHGGVLGWLVILLVAFVVGAAFSGISHAFALLMRREETVIAVANFVGLPLMFLSTMLISAGAMPSWIQHVASFNPVNWAAEAARAVELPGTDWGRVAEHLGLLFAVAALTSAWALGALRRYRASL